MKKHLSFFALFFACLSLFSQKYVAIADSLTDNNPGFLVENWKQYYNAEKSLNNKAEILSLVSVAYQELGDVHKMLEFIDMAEQEGKPLNDPEFIYRTKRNRTFALALLGRTDEAIEKSFELLKDLTLIKDENSRKLNEAITLSQIGNYYGELKNEDKLFFYQKKAIKLLESLPKTETVNYALGNNYFNFGYYLLNDSKKPEIDKAELYLNKAIKIPRASEALKAFCHSALADISYQKNDINESLEHLNLALPYLETTKNSALYETYNLLSIVYKLKGNNNKSQEFRQKYNLVRNFLTQEELTGVNSSIKDIEDKRIAMQKKSLNQKLTISAIGLIIIIGLIIYYFQQKIALKTQKKNYESIIAQMKTQSITNDKSPSKASTLDSKLIESYTENSIVTEVNNQENPSKKQSISIELEATLLQKLYRFEQGNKFINPNISLASLAGALGTNTQYLSELINKQKNKNFNTYINELRINFIIKRILEDRKLANYKIAALAEEAGFSSHSLFSKVFKQVTNMSPSEFIHEHQKSNS